MEWEREIEDAKRRQCCRRRRERAGQKMGPGEILREGKALEYQRRFIDDTPVRYFGQDSPLR